MEHVLFTLNGLDAVLDAKTRAVRRSVYNMAESDLDNEELVVEQMIEDHGLRAIELVTDGPQFSLSDPNSDGQEVVLRVPFAGSGELLEYRPTEYSANRTEFRQSRPGMLVLNRTWTPAGSATRDEVTRWAEQEIELLATWVKWANAAVPLHNMNVEGTARAVASERRAALAHRRTLAEELGATDDQYGKPSRDW